MKEHNVTWGPTSFFAPGVFSSLLICSFVNSTVVFVSREGEKGKKKLVIIIIIKGNSLIVNSLRIRGPVTASLICWIWPNLLHQHIGQQLQKGLVLPATPWYCLVQTKPAPTPTLIEILPASACHSNIGSKKKKSGK